MKGLLGGFCFSLVFAYTLEPIFLGSAQRTDFVGEICRGVFAAGISVDQTVEAPYLALATVAYHLHDFFFARFKTDGGCGRYVKVTAECLLPVKFKISVDFKEMEVRTDLNGTVAGIVYGDFRRVTVGIVFDRCRIKDDTYNRV